MLVMCCFITVWDSTDFLLDCVPLRWGSSEREKEPATTCTIHCPLCKGDWILCWFWEHLCYQSLEIHGSVAGYQLLNLENYALLLHHLKVWISVRDLILSPPLRLYLARLCGLGLSVVMLSYEINEVINTWLEIALWKEEIWKTDLRSYATLLYSFPPQDFPLFLVLQQQMVTAQ